MTFSYDNTNINDDVSRVRFLTGDTVSPGDNSDEEIAFLLSVSGNYQNAALMAARAQLSKFARLADVAVGDLKITYSARVKAWLEVIAQLDLQISKLVPTTIYSGGLSQADEDLDDLDTDLKSTIFEYGIHDLPFSADSSIDQLRTDV